MSSSITERILGNNRIYTDKYYRDIFLLTKSFTIYSKDECLLYNNLITEFYGTHVDSSKPETWRYHKHLTGNYHETDKPIELVSIDNGNTIVLSKDTIIYHRSTRDELLKFGYYYKELVDKYPTQELLIKSIINTSPSLTMDEVLSLDNWSIVGFNQNLVEPQETNLIPDIQKRLDNYKVHHLLTSYGLMEPYYMASLFSILYTFLLKSVLAIRLGNDKTERAHSYHILNYLSSHHGLDKHFNYLTKKQVLFLYRNLLYLNNHSGRNETFQTLIDRLFTEKRVSVVNYRQKQKNSTDDKGGMQYRFNQVLLNKANLVYATNDFTLEDIRDRERDLYKGNEKEYEYNTESIDFTNQNSLYSYLRTKDLEVNLVDNTNDVRRTLIPMIIDYWGYMLSIGRLNFISSVVDPITNVDYRLNVRDMFKLFSVVLHKYNDIVIETFPDFVANRVFKPNLPTESVLVSKLYKPEWTIRKLVKQMLQSVPSYVSCDTAYSFNLFITDVYNVNLGHWLLVCNQADKDINAQLEGCIENLNHKGVYKFDTEPVPVFLKRIGFSSVLDYEPNTLYDILMNILNSVTYNKLGELGRNRYVQEALTQIFRQFNSYTVQLIDKYFSTESILANLKSPLYGLEVDSHAYHYYLHDQTNFVDTFIVKKDLVKVSFNTDVKHTKTTKSEIDVDFSEKPLCVGSDIIYVPVQLTTPGVLVPVELEVTPDVDQETLLFLSLNL